MLKKNLRELSMVGGKDPKPTLEIQADSLDAHNLYLGKIVSTALADFAAKNPTRLATVYSFGTMSTNFHDMAWSEFLIVAGDTKVLQALGTAFARYPGVKSRFSDYITPSEGRATYHVQDGRLWEVEDAVTWYSADPAEQSARAASQSIADDDVEDEEDEEDEDDWGVGEDDEADDDEDEGAASTAAAVKRGRLNAARADAKVSTIRRNIEKVFGLPEGSVSLCGPDKTPMKGNALIKTLRRRWEES